MDPETLTFDDDGSIPNNSDLPALVYRGLPAVAGGAAACERLFAANGWTGAWRDGIYPFHHYHSTDHEALGIVRGSATVTLGGAGGAVLRVGAGDVLVLPAGTGHRNDGSSPDLLVVGAYPGGRMPDLLTGRPGERPAALARIRAVPVPAADPVTGTEGGLCALWRRPRA